MPSIPPLGAPSFYENCLVELYTVIAPWSVTYRIVSEFNG